MDEELSFISSLQREQPQLWQTIVSAANEGLIIIDQENDAVTATNRLLLTYPGLHDILAFITNQWTENQMNTKKHFQSLVHNRNV